MINLIHGDCFDELKKLPDNSVDSIVTDPPYGLKFMGKKWDYDVPSVEIWEEANARIEYNKKHNTNQLKIKMD